MGWTLDKAALSDALKRFDATYPPTAVRESVNERLMDLAEGPLSRGQEEEDHPGIFVSRIPGTNLSITYVPDPATMIVHVVAIHDAS